VLRSLRRRLYQLIGKENAVTGGVGSSRISADAKDSSFVAVCEASRIMTALRMKDESRNYTLGWY
jgi:hypothetical protein